MPTTTTTTTMTNDDQPVTITPTIHHYDQTQPQNQPLQRQPTITTTKHHKDKPPPPPQQPPRPPRPLCHLTTTTTVKITIVRGWRTTTIVKTTMLLKICIHKVWLIKRGLIKFRSNPQAAECRLLAYLPVACSSNLLTCLSHWMSVCLSYFLPVSLPAYRYACLLTFLTTSLSTYTCLPTCYSTYLPLTRFLAGLTGGSGLRGRSGSATSSPAKPNIFVLPRGNMCLRIFRSVYLNKSCSNSLQNLRNIVFSTQNGSFTKTTED